MAYEIFDISADPNAESFLSQENHVTCYCDFAVSGTPVWVTSPSFKLLGPLPSSGDATPTLLRPLQRVDTGEVGVYITTFLTNGIKEGNYTVQFTGNYGSTPLTTLGSMSMRPGDRTQAVIDNLRVALSDKYNSWIPNQYLTFDPQKHRWEDYELYAALKRAVDDINNAIPPTPENFTIGDCPALSLMMLGGQMYALLAKGILEASNFFDITLPVRVTLYKGDKYRDFASFIAQNYYQTLIMWKKGWVIATMRPKIVTMLRVPMRVLRPLSDNLFFHSVAGWY